MIKYTLVYFDLDRKIVEIDIWAEDNFIAREILQDNLRLGTAFKFTHDGIRHWVSF